MEQVASGVWIVAGGFILSHDAEQKVPSYMRQKSGVYSGIDASIIALVYYRELADYYGQTLREAWAEQYLSAVDTMQRFYPRELERFTAGGVE